LKRNLRFAKIVEDIDGSREVPRVEITKVEIRPMRDEGNLKAFCSVVFDDVFIVHSVKIIQGKEALFVAMPSREVKGGDFRDTAHPIDNEFRLQMESKILAMYHETVGQSAEVLVTRTEDATF
jgi:stage V sporulation protein G